MLIAELFAYGADTSVRFYSSDPSHSWNGAYEALFVRVAASGAVYDDLLDPPLWARTKFLLEPGSNARAIQALEKFEGDRVALREMRPIQRAMMQRDLIAVFCWLVEGHVGGDQRSIYRVDGLRAKLGIALARAIKFIALSTDEIHQLADNYAAAAERVSVQSDFDPSQPDAPFLPRDLLAEDGPWIALEPYEGDPDGLSATRHFDAFLGRSAFEVRMRHPEGRAAGERYLKQLAEMPKPMILEKPRTVPAFVPDAAPWPNPATPLFPTNTVWALVRRAVLCDGEGNPVVSPLIESVQMRVYRRFETIQSDPKSQIFIEWELSRKLLFGKGGFRRSQPGDSRFPHFYSKGFDPFENGWELEPEARPAVLNCGECHSTSGLNSVLSRSRFFEDPKSFPVKFRPGKVDPLSQTTEFAVANRPEWTALRWIIATRP